MATGKHMGKVMIKVRGTDGQPVGQQESTQTQSEGHNGVPPPVYIKSIRQTYFHPDHAYIITGGLGGFGLELASWMIQKGAKKLVISSRNGLRTTFQHNAIKRFKEAVIGYGDKSLAENIVVSNHDVSTVEGTRALINEGIKIGPVVGGIFHLAMVLNDALLENQTKELFEATCLSKVTGSINLDKVSKELCPNLDYFVCFSSVACGRGNTGQTNYGFANSVMERLCENRRVSGLPGLAIQWGAIGDVGIVAESMGGNDVVIGGTIPQRMPSCFDTLNQVLLFSKDTKLQKYQEEGIKGQLHVPIVVSSIVKADKKKSGIGGGGGKGDLVRQICHILGVKDHTKLDPNTTLGDLGLDSLMAVEIRQGLERDYDMVLSAQEVRQLKIKDIQEIESSKAAEDGDKKAAADGQKKSAASANDGIKSLTGSPADGPTFGSSANGTGLGIPKADPNDHVIII